MVYKVYNGPAVDVGDTGIPPGQIHRLEYTSKDKWVDTVLESTPIVNSYGTFSSVGSYRRVDGRKYTEYDATFGDFDEDRIEENTRRIPGSFLAPFLMELLREKQRIVADGTVVTTALVCFHDICQQDATGLLYNRNGQGRVYADDSRGIPLRLGDGFRFQVIELRVDDVQRCPSGENAISELCSGP
jgi:hypothetical protein